MPVTVYSVHVRMRGICDTTMAGTLLQPYALMHPPLTAPEGNMSEGCVNLFAC